MRVVVLISLVFQVVTSETSPQPESEYPVTRIRKCCSTYETLNITFPEKVDCVQQYQNSLWQPTLYREPEVRQEVRNGNISFDIVGFPECKWRVLSNKLDKWFNIMENGDVAVGLNFWTIPIWLRPSGFCVDSMMMGSDENSTNKEENYVLVFCELENFGKYLAIRTVFPVLFMISAASILVTMVIYLLLWNEQSIHGWTQFSWLLSSFLYLTFEGSRQIAKVNGLNIVPSTACFVQAIFAHYFTVALSGTCCMMCVDCFVTFWKLKSVREKTKREMAIYLALAWGIPILALSTGLYLHFTQNPEEAKKHAVGVFEYAHYRCSSPVWEFAFRAQLLLSVVNVLAFIGTGCFIIKHYRSTGVIYASRRNKFKKALQLFVKLFSITGLGWVLSAIDLVWGYQSPMGLQFLIIRAFTSVQGVVCLLIFGLHRKNFTLLKKKYPIIQESALLSRVFGATSSSTSAYTNTTSRQRSNTGGGGSSGGHSVTSSSTSHKTRVKFSISGEDPSVEIK